jgi:hypothetical protein
MTLTMRPAGLSSGVYKAQRGLRHLLGEWCIGRIYENRSGPKELRWLWALHAPGGRETLRSSNQVPTLEAAKFEVSLVAWKAWRRWKRCRRNHDNFRNDNGHSQPVGRRCSWRRVSILVAA